MASITSPGRRFSDAVVRPTTGPGSGPGPGAAPTVRRLPALAGMVASDADAGSSAKVCAATGAGASQVIPKQTATTSDRKGAFISIGPPGRHDETAGRAADRTRTSCRSSTRMLPGKGYG